MKRAPITMAWARACLDGGVESAELASRGRRTAEMELQLRHLMEGP